MDSSEENIICNCMFISEHEIVDAIKNKGATTVEDIQEITDAGTGCGSCIPDLEEILERELGS
jgi:NAD(P)H-nitrite reductase large subunit